MICLREMKQTDIGQIARLEAEIFADAWTKDGVEETWRQPQTFIVTAEENGETAGYCIVYYVLDEAEIARIAVAPGRRCAGVGSAVLKKTEELCVKRGVRRLMLDVRAGNETARRFYKRHGFAEDGIRKGFYENPAEDAVLMSRFLTEVPTMNVREGKV